ncbi:uncharacterized protein EV422DRAFT_522752 [Fimicolochytrium jonesii]|uniref:uncharacterized protein n=1 Tax=Fimicolochytrium jonesii TaxID=1396493 RepID=UPI0022FDCEE6|nr:uncharacterized protein EV422DRAFT_522752 [Fimicolochytrium jonesii]KAI8822938.1 hypothetical protein EV422DRAFT_522752 [Fimicolochytrium jonesii]
MACHSHCSPPAFPPPFFSVRPKRPPRVDIHLLWQRHRTVLYLIPAAAAHPALLARMLAADPPPHVLHGILRTAEPSPSHTLSNLPSALVTPPVEACLLPTATARYDHTRKHIESFLRDTHPSVVLHTKLAQEDFADVPFLRENVEFIRVCEVRGRGCRAEGLRGECLRGACASERLLEASERSKENACNGEAERSEAEPTGPPAQDCGSHTIPTSSSRAERAGYRSSIGYHSTIGCRGSTHQP